MEVNTRSPLAGLAAILRRMETTDTTRKSDTITLSLPGIVEVSAGFGPFSPGDQLHVRAAETFEAERWVLVERAGGARSLVRCAERDGRRVLVDAAGDAMLYEPARHRIIARVYGRLEAM